MFVDFDAVFNPSPEQKRLQEQQFLQLKNDKENKEDDIPIKNKPYFSSFMVEMVCIHACTVGIDPYDSSKKQEFTKGQKTEALIDNSGVRFLEKYNGEIPVYGWPFSIDEISNHFDIVRSSRNTEENIEELSKASVNYNSKIHLQKSITVDFEIELDKNDIFNWLNSCENPETLKYLGRAALNFARAIEEPDTDDFRSRV